MRVWRLLSFSQFTVASEGRAHVGPTPNSVRPKTAKRPTKAFHSISRWAAGHSSRSLEVVFDGMDGSQMAFWTCDQIEPPRPT